MKNSERFKFAQVAVIEHQLMATDKKLEVLRLLMKEEDMELFMEKEKERKAQVVDTDGEL